MAARIDPDGLASVVALACRAPSVHNSQPWRLTAESGVLRVFLEPHRVPHATDLSGREALISCGALIDHIRVAAASAGWESRVSQFPNPNALDHLATIEFHPREMVTEADRARADAVLQRRTDRLPFEAPEGWTFIEPVLREVVSPDQASLHVLDESMRPQLAEASRMTESLRRYDDYYQAELRWWTAPFEVSDGVPYNALAGASERDRVDVARAFPAEAHPDRRPEVDRDRSMIVVLSTAGDDRREALGCGETLSRVLLEATMLGLSTCTLTHLTELEASRGIVRALIGEAGDPQVLIRIGQVPPMADQPPPTPRRPLADVLEMKD